MDIKVLIIGETNVGKTSLIRQFIENKFSDEKISTIGYDTIKKEITIKNKKMQLLIWDTCGQEQYRSINNMFLKNSKIVIFVYDITNKKSFIELQNYWYPLVNHKLGNEIILGIAGNKSDLYENENVNEEEVRKFSNNINATFNLTTAKNNEAINYLIKDLLTKYIENGNYEKDLENEKNNINTILIEEQDENKKKNKVNCCKKQK
jgi:small GTP-binding protein